MCKTYTLSEDYIKKESIELVKGNISLHQDGLILFYDLHYKIDSVGNITLSFIPNKGEIISMVKTTYDKINNILKYDCFVRKIETKNQQNKYLGILNYDSNAKYDLILYW